MTDPETQSSTEGGAGGDVAENIHHNPKSWAAWKREAERLAAEVERITRERDETRTQIERTAASEGLEVRRLHEEISKREVRAVQAESREAALRAALAKELPEVEYTLTRLVGNIDGGWTGEPGRSALARIRAALSALPVEPSAPPGAAEVMRAYGVAPPGWTNGDCAPERLSKCPVCENPIHLVPQGTAHRHCSEYVAFRTGETIPAAPASTGERGGDALPPEVEEEIASVLRRHASRFWYVEARIGSQNHRGESIRFVNDRRGDPTLLDGESSYENSTAEVVVGRLLDLLALATRAPASGERSPRAGTARGVSAIDFALDSFEAAVRADDKAKGNRYSSRDGEYQVEAASARLAGARHGFRSMLEERASPPPRSSGTIASEGGE